MFLLLSGLRFFQTNFKLNGFFFYFLIFKKDLSVYLFERVRERAAQGDRQADLFLKAHYRQDWTGLKAGAQNPMLATPWIAILRRLRRCIRRKLDLKTTNWDSNQYSSRSGLTHCTTTLTPVTWSLSSDVKAICWSKKTAIFFFFTLGVVLLCGGYLSRKTSHVRWILPCGVKGLASSHQVSQELDILRTEYKIFFQYPSGISNNHKTPVFS